MADTPRNREQEWLALGLPTHDGTATENARLVREGYVPPIKTGECVPNASFSLGGGYPFVAKPVAQPEGSTAELVQRLNAIYRAGDEKAAFEAIAGLNRPKAVPLNTWIVPFRLQARPMEPKDFPWTVSAMFTAGVLSSRIRTSLRSAWSSVFGGRDEPSKPEGPTGGTEPR